MKILLVQAWLGKGRNLLVYPLGLAYLATVLEEAGHEVKMADPNVLDRPLEDTVRIVKAFSPHAVGISFRNIDNQLRIHPIYHYKGFQQTLEAIRPCCPSTPIIVGGPAFSMAPELIMERNPSIDLGVYLEAEESFPELLENLGGSTYPEGIYHRDATGGVCFSGKRHLPDFAALPIPRRHFLDPAPYMRDSLESMGIQTRRGCPLSCTYCVYPQLNGKHWRLRTPEHVMEEIDYLISTWGVRRITFADSVVNLPYDHSTRLFTLLKEKGKGLEWMGYMHVSGLTRDYLNLCLQSGCVSLIFSPDALSPGALKGLGKNIAPEDIRRLKNMVDQNAAFRKMRIEWTFFINPPGETLWGMLRTLWFYFSTKVSQGKRNRNCFINWIRLEPSSSVYRRALDEGVVKPDTDLLPEDAAGLSKTFYSAPGLSRLDPLIMALLRAPRKVRNWCGSNDRTH